MSAIRTIDEFGTVLIYPVDGPEAVICYEFSESSTATYSSLQYAWLAGSFDSGFFDSVFNSNPPGAVGTFAPIPVHDGTNWIADGSVEAALVANVIPLLQTQWPSINSVKLTVDSGGTLFIDFYDASNPSASFSGNTLGVGGASQIFVLSEAAVEVAAGTAPVYVRQVQLGGVSTYYEGGVQVVDLARIAQIELMIINASPDQAFTCPPDGSETVVTAGSNVNVTGSGTAASPYVVSVAGGSSQALVLHAMTSNQTAFDNINISKRANYSDTVINTFGSGWNPVTGTLTVPTTGYYRVEAQVEGSVNWGPSGYLNCRMFVNDVNAQTPQGLRHQEWPDSGGQVILSSRLSRIVQLNAGDQIDVRVQGSPSTSTTANRPDHNYFVVEFIGS